MTGMIKITNDSPFEFCCPACRTEGEAQRKAFGSPKYQPSVIPTHPPAVHPPETYGFPCPSCGHWITNRDKKGKPLGEQIFEVPAPLGGEPLAQEMHEVHQRNIHRGKRAKP